MEKRLLTAFLFIFIGIMQGRSGWAGGGTSYFSDPINWQFTGELRYTVEGAPANVCGDLHTLRNGQTLVAPAWICTDSNGHATKGPWTWSNTPSDQTDKNVSIWWPDGTQTLPFRNHIWDKSCPTTVSNPLGSIPPSSFSGSASDVAWGAGFNASWSNVQCRYRQTSPDGQEVRYWTSGNTYSTIPQVSVQGTVSGMPGFNVTWSCPVPPADAHIPGYCYRWEAGVTDGGCRPYTSRSFCR